MTVAELIAKLQTLPQEMNVIINVESIGETFNVDPDVLVYDKTVPGFNMKYDSPEVILFAA